MTTLRPPRDGSVVKHDLHDPSHSQLFLQIHDSSLVHSEFLAYSDFILLSNVISQRQFNYFEVSDIKYVMEDFNMITFLEILKRKLQNY